MPSRPYTRANVLPVGARGLSPGLVTAVAAVLAGIAVTRSPVLVFTLVAVLVGGVGLMLLPLPKLIPALVVGMVIVPSVVLAHVVQGRFSGIPFLGQSTLVAVVAIVCVGRAVLEGRSMRFPVGISTAIVAYVAGILVSVMVALASGHAYGGMLSELARQIALVLAFVIGVVGGQAVQSRRDRIALFRAIAIVGVVAAGLAVVYWLWAVGIFSPPLVAGVFKASESATNFATDRSLFPFVEDGANLSATIIVAFAAFAAPPLLLSGEPRNRRLAGLLAGAVVLATLTTQSRTGLVALVVTPIPFLLLMPRGPSRRRVIVGLLVLLMVGYGGYQALFPSGRHLSTHTSAMVIREDIWKQAYAKFSEKPILGQGYHYSARNNFLVSTTDVAAGADTFQYTSVHNEYLGQLVDGGVFGGLIFLYLFVSFGRLGLTLTRRPFGRGEGIGVICLLVSLLSSMLVNASFQSAAVALLMFLFIGVAASNSDALDIDFGPAPATDEL